MKKFIRLEESHAVRLAGSALALSAAVAVAAGVVAGAGNAAPAIQGRQGLAPAED